MEDEIGAGTRGPVQLRKARVNGWTKARRTAFLTELALSCNVVRAHAAAGMGSSGAYRLRDRDPEFARQWQESLVAGYERLETALLRRALEVVDGFELVDAQEPVVPMTVEQAISVLNQYRRHVREGQAGRQKQGRRIATQEETDAVLIKRIAMVKRQRAGRTAICDGRGEGDQ